MKNKLGAIVTLEDLLKKIVEIYSEGFDNARIDVKEEYDGSRRIAFTFIKKNEDDRQDEFKAIYLKLLGK